MAYNTSPQKKSVLNLKRSTQTPINREMAKLHSEPPTFAMLKDAGDAYAEPPPVPDPKLKDDENPTKPFSITSPRDFEDMSLDMHRLFEGKETEQNWDKRRKAIIKISRITHGNAPNEFHSQYISFLKAQLDGILKVVDSLRTNVSTAGLNLLQHMANTLGHGVDFMIDFVAETLITRCCNTSKVKRDPAIATFETIIGNASCNKNLLHYILSASEHKDPNARNAVSGWLTVLLTKNGRHCDQPGVLDLIEKCIKNGLNDAKPQVRTPMRSTFTAYGKLWPDRAERLRSGLDAKTQKMLETSTATEPVKPSLKTRPSIKDIKAARKRELDAQEGARPASAQSNRPSIKEIKAAKLREMGAKEIPRPASAQSMQSTTNDGKTMRRRDMVLEDSIAPPSAQSMRQSVRETKHAKRREAEPEALARPPSSQSNHNKKRDAEPQDTSRPITAQFSTSTMERRFHILSSAPMRPQRGLGEIKRTAPTSSRPLLQQAHTEPPTPHPSDNQRTGRPADRKPPDPRGEARSGPKPDTSHISHTRAKTVQIDGHEREVLARPASIATPRVRHVDLQRNGAQPDIPRIGEAGIFSDKAQLEQHIETQKNVPLVFKHDRTQSEKHIEIHEDEVTVDQEEPLTASEVRKTKSEESMMNSKDGLNIGMKKKADSPLNPPTVLREIDQLNETVEPLKRQENSRQKYISTETAERNRSISPHSKNPDKARKQLGRAIEKVRSRTMDDYGYRRLQGLIKAHDTLFQDEQRYDDLLLALLDTLETPNTEKRMPLSRQHDNKFQILVTVRLMLEHNAKYCVAYYPRALSALVTARRNFESRSHIVGGLEETAEEIIAACSPTEVIDPILDVLELQEHDDTGYRAISMGLHILTGVVARIKGDEVTDKTQEERLARFASICLRNENSETRRSTISFCVELRRLINPEERYFQLVAGNDEALRSLLTYFIATAGRR
jgi:CLIP-associating protein 1/2